ncbi:MAG: M20/M25/M40 family metallo-hydrolase [Halieaceae bacterium]|jgi:carboxypeptidase PM20D1|nr:M20/M25/M40 family metallo-hydrolase [Halieaceae bacterium]
MPRSTVFVTILFLLGLFAGGTAASPAERLGSAVRFKTISYQDHDQVDYSEFAAFHRFMRDSFPRVFGALEVETINGYSLLLRWPGSDGALPPVLFTAHMDVVPVEPGTEQDWQHPAFDGVVADGRIYGRGTLDDKVGVMGLLEAAEQLLAAGFSPARTVYFAFGHDEEISGRQGAKAIAARMRELGLHFSWMVDEGGMLVSDNPLLAGKTMAMVNIAEKGYLTLTLRTTGEGGHSSNPPAVSSIGRLANALARIEAKPFPPRLVEPVEAMLEALAPHMEQPERLVFENLWLTDGLVAGNMAKERTTAPFVRTTTALTMFNGGVKENVVPQRAEARVNFRLLPGDTPASVVDYIAGVVDDPLVEISYEAWDEMPPVAEYPGSGYGVIQAAIERVYPDAVVVPSMLMAVTDTRHYIDLVDNQYRFHGVRMATSQATSIHGTDEYVDVDSYEKSIEIARLMIELGAQ